MGGMEEMVQREKRETVFTLERKGNQERWDLQERKGARESMECRDLLGFQVPVD